MDFSTQLGYIVLISDESGKANVLHYTSKRVVLSVLGGKTLAFSNSFDAAFSSRIDLMPLLKKDIKLTMITDSISFFKILVNLSIMTEKRLMIDLAVVRQ